MTKKPKLTAPRKPRKPRKPVSKSYVISMTDDCGRFQFFSNPQVFPTYAAALRYAEEKRIQHFARRRTFHVFKLAATVSSEPNLPPPPYVTEFA